MVSYSFKLICLASSLCAMEDANLGYFFKAIHRNNIKQVDDCIKQGVDINALDVNGKSGLYYALKEKRFSIALNLLKQKNIHISSSYQSLLHTLITSFSSSYEYPDHMCLIARSLLAKGAFINEKTDRKTPLLLALENYKPVSFIECLIDHGAFIDRHILVEALNLSPHYIKTVLKSPFIAPYDLLFMLTACKKCYEECVGKLVLIDSGYYEPEKEEVKQFLDPNEQLKKEIIEEHKKKYETECKQLKKKGRIIKRYFQTMCDLNYHIKHPLFWKKDKYTKAAQLVAYHTAKNQK